MVSVATPPVAALVDTNVSTAVAAVANIIWSVSPIKAQAVVT